MVPSVAGAMLTEQPAELELALARAQLPLGLNTIIPVGGVAPEAAVSVTVAVHVVG